MVVRISSNEHLEWIKAKKWYNIPLEKVADTPDIMRAQQMIMVENGEVVKRVFMPDRLTQEQSDDSAQRESAQAI